MVRRIALIPIAAVVVVAAVGFVLVYRPAMAPVAAAQTFDPALVARGSELAAVGDCASCHTAPGGAPLAGGVEVPTPFGTIYSSNITPDSATGIGTWSEAAFTRAMQEGVDREGHHLYPAFPFDHFTHVTPDDDKAIYAYLMTRDAVNQEPPANRLNFPFNIRGLMAFWDVLFLHKGPITDDSTQTAEWNHGRYLVEGLGHCAACHTPRNSFGAEDGAKAYAGGPVIDGWYTYPINANSPAPNKWTAAELAAYLKTGFSADHGASRGPMAQVTARLSEANRDDVQAMATYVAWLMGSTGAATTASAAIQQPILTSGDSLAPPTAPTANDRGAVVYASACSACHESGRAPPFGGIDFHKSTAVSADSPQNIINMVLYGLPAAEGRTGGNMPGFAGSISQDDLTALLTYLRATYANGKPAWSNADMLVADTMSGKTIVKLYGQDGVQRAIPGAVAQRTTP